MELETLKTLHISISNKTLNEAYYKKEDLEKYLSLYLCIFVKRGKRKCQEEDTGHTHYEKYMYEPQEAD